MDFGLGKTTICNLRMYRCSDLLNAAVLLITKTASKMLFDQFSSCRYKWRKLFCFHYVTVKNTSFPRRSSIGHSTQSVRYKKISLYTARVLSWCERIFAVPWGFVSPCYTVLGTKEINAIGLSEAPGLLLSLTITSNVLVSTPCNEMTKSLKMKMLKQHNWTCKFL